MSKIDILDKRFVILKDHLGDEFSMWNIVDRINVCRDSFMQNNDRFPTLILISFDLVGRLARELYWVSPHFETPAVDELEKEIYSDTLKLYGMDLMVLNRWDGVVLVR